MRSTDSANAEESAAFHEAVVRGVAAADAGRVVAYEAVRSWMLSWGTESESPPPPCK